MSGIFESPYAHHYDALYGEKNYEGECDAIERLLRDYSVRTTRAILDLGCGTGTHALFLAQRGYAVTGVDRSAPMLELAREKTSAGGANRAAAAPEFFEGDVRTVRLGRTFDAALMMFAVLGYQTTDADLTSALGTVAAHLRPGGVFVCDVWFGPAVEAIGTSDREKIIEAPGGVALHRTSSGLLDRAKHTCRVRFKTWRSTGGAVSDLSTEDHTMRYFFEAELETFFAAAGLELCTVRPFDNLDAPPGNESWNVWVCGRAR